MQDKNAPIIVAVAQQTYRDGDTARTPADALQQVAQLAIDDANNEGLLGSIDTVAHIRFISDTNPDTAALMPRNPGKRVAERLGMNCPRVIQGAIGGNTPQYMVNQLASELAAGKTKVAMLMGAELLGTFFGALKTGGDISGWAGEDTEQPPTVGHDRDGATALEMAHGLYEPIVTYPLFEMAFRHHSGGTADEHNQRVGNIYSAMSKVAANNPHSWRRDALTAEQVATVDAKNRLISEPYPKAVNSVLAVDMAAAIIMTTVGEAERLGIDESQWVYMRAGADLNEQWFVSERVDLHRAEAIGQCVGAALKTANLSVDDMSAFDIYSCFPSAVEIACNEIGLKSDDPRGVTVTGAMPFFGGPGNNYTLHSIAQMTENLRGKPNTHGLVTGNGMYLTKHSVGIYSTAPGEGPWQATDCSAMQQRIDDGPKAKVIENAEGAVTIVTYTVKQGREGADRAVILADTATGERVVAVMLASNPKLATFTEQASIGMQGTVTTRDGITHFDY